MGKAQLSPIILDYLSKKSGLETGTVRKKISLLRRKNPSLPLNAVAHLYALSIGFSVLGKLSKEEKLTLPHVDIEKTKTKISVKKPVKKSNKAKTAINYQSGDYFMQGHIVEINHAYTARCFTSVHILARKIIENLVREILAKQFPPTNFANKELYFDTAQRRFKDFSVLLKNLFDNRHHFEPSKIKAIERLYDKTKKFKDEANDSTHSWYHVIKSEKEINDLEIQTIIELIKAIEK